jgi:hypothetical protein
MLDGLGRDRLEAQPLALCERQNAGVAENEEPEFRAALSWVLLDRKRRNNCGGNVVTGAYRVRKYRMGKVDSDAFEPVPREFAVKAEPSSEVTAKALLRKSLRRLYQPLSDAQPERSVSC